MNVHQRAIPVLPKWLSSDLIEALPIAVYVGDDQGVVVAYNRRASELWGREPVCGDTQERFCGAHKLYLADETFIPHDQTPMANVLVTHAASGEFEAIVGRPDGSKIPVLASVSPLFSEDNKFIGFVNCVQDMRGTQALRDDEARSREEARKAEARREELELLLAQLQASEENRQLLSKELQHRVKNTFAVVQSLVKQTLKTTTNADEAARLIGERLNALGKTYDILAHESWERAPLRALVNAALDIHKLDGERLEIDGPSILLSGSEAMGFTLVLHELTTNAVKYGALSTNVGRLMITWRILDDRLCFTWQERAGPTVSVPTSRGFGSKLIERALQSSGRQSTISYLPEGVCWTLNAPLDGFATVE